MRDIITECRHGVALMDECDACRLEFESAPARRDGLAWLHGHLTAEYPGCVGPIVSITTKPTPELLYFDARAALLDAAAAVAEFLGTDNAERINTDLAEHSRLGETAATATLADALADLYRANDEWQRAQTQRFAPEQVDPEDA